MTEERDAPHLTDTEALAAAKAVTALFQRWNLYEPDLKLFE